MNTSILLFLLFIAIVIGLVAGYKILDSSKNSKFSIKSVIQIFAALGIGATIFGIGFLIYSATLPKDMDEYKEKLVYEQEFQKGVHNYKKYEIGDEFELERLKFTQDTLETATIIFTVAGIFLGALGIFWLGYLEESRNHKDRYHDQLIQKDRILSLLTLGIDLFIKIDKEILDFMDDNSSEQNPKKLEECRKNHKECIVYNDVCFKKFTAAYKENESLKLKYEEHLVSLYQFLYESKNFKRKTILEDIYIIIEELQKVYYEEDLLLFDAKCDNEDQYKKKREYYLVLLKQYTDYKNFLQGNTDVSDFSVGEYKTFEKSLATLLNAGKESKEINPISYLNQQYQVTKKNNKLFYEEFIHNYSKEFSETFLTKESSLFLMFDISEIKDIFAMMQTSSLDASKFFNSYFKASFKEYVNEKSEYSDINLNANDLEFKEYIKIFQEAFERIEADINSVKELYSLFYSFVKLHSEFKGEES